MILQSWHVLVVGMASLINRQQASVTDGNHLIDARNLSANTDGPIGCRTRLGGLLRYYHREAA